ncbi:MAG TPA: preprotein translocase subunit SecG [Hanamia sp.]
MLLLFGILIILSSIILGVIVLIQNPKGGGLSSSLGGFSNQLMGVKQTTDVLEKGTWLFAAIIGVLCLTSTLFIPKSGGVNSRDNLINQAPVGTPLAPQQNNTAPLSAPQTQAPAPQK